MIPHFFAIGAGILAGGLGMLRAWQMGNPVALRQFALIFVVAIVIGIGLVVVAMEEGQ